MRELRLVAISDDGARLILRADGDDTPMSLPLDERLHAALRGDRARLGQLEIQMDSQLRPRDIQARVRSGESVQSVAAAAGVPLDRVMRFAGPVLAEREHIAQRAQEAVIRRSSGDAANRPLRETVAEWAGSYDTDPETVEWDAWRRDDGRWLVTASWLVGESERRAEFTFDPTGRSVVPDNDEARAVAGERPAAPHIDTTPQAGAPGQPVSEPADRAGSAGQPEVVEPQPAATGPARLSVVADPPDEDVEVAGEPEPAAVNAERRDHADEQPTVPVPIPSSREQRQGERGRLRDDRRRPRSREERPDPWAREDTSDRLRLSDIASRVETEGDDAADQIPASVPAASGDVPSQPADTAPARPKRSRSKRPSVPSWDEIMFGRREKD